jgi:hypothetical protein
MKALILGLLWLGAGALAAPGESGVHGRITLSPACAGAQPEDASCARPMAQVQVELRKEDGTPVAATRSAADGSYAMQAPPGRYRLHVQGRAKLQRCPVPVVEIPAGAHAVADVECDSGMR